MLHLKGQAAYQPKSIFAFIGFAEGRPHETMGKIFFNELRRKFMVKSRGSGIDVQVKDALVVENPALTLAVVEVGKARPTYNPITDLFTSGTAPSQTDMVGIIRAMTQLKLLGPGACLVCCQHMCRYLARHNCQCAFPEQVVALRFLDFSTTKPSPRRSRL